MLWSLPHTAVLRTMYAAATIPSQIWPLVALSKGLSIRSFPWKTMEDQAIGGATRYLWGFPKVSIRFKSSSKTSQPSNSRNHSWLWTSLIFYLRGEQKWILSVATGNTSWSSSSSFPGKKLAEFHITTNRTIPFHSSWSYTVPCESGFQYKTEHTWNNGPKIGDY